MYNPNFSDPRVLKRIKTALGFALGTLSQQPHAWSTRYIDRYFGQQQNPLSNWLRTQLLICTDPHYNKDAGQSKQYQLNQSGANRIRDIISGRQSGFTNQSVRSELDILTPDNHRMFDQQVVGNWIRKEFATELETGTFNYKDKSSRLWHPLQNIRRIHKREILADYNLKYHYDIKCAAPTLILQHAQQQPDSMDLYLSDLADYLKNRTQIRQELAQALEVDTRTIKVLINALFCGARIGNNPAFAISQLLANDKARIEYLKQNRFITGLRDDIKTCWTYITPGMSRISVQDQNQKERLLPISSKQKWIRYFNLERTILNSVVGYMHLRNYKYFLEHDGWACDNKIDLTELETHVLSSTGFRVVFESELVKTNKERNQASREMVE